MHACGGSLHVCAVKMDTKKLHCICKRVCCVKRNATGTMESLATPAFAKKGMWTVISIIAPYHRELKEGQQVPKGLPIGVNFRGFFSTFEAADKHKLAVAGDDGDNNLLVAPVDWMQLPPSEDFVESKNYKNPFIDAIMKAEKETRIENLAGLVTPLPVTDEDVENAVQDLARDNFTAVPGVDMNCREKKEDYSEDDLAAAEMVTDVDVSCSLFNTRNYKKTEFKVPVALAHKKDTLSVVGQRFMVFSCVCEDGYQDTIYHSLGIRVWQIFPTHAYATQFIEKYASDFGMALMIGPVHEFFKLPPDCFIANPDGEAGKHFLSKSMEEIASDELTIRTLLAQNQERRIQAQKDALNLRNRMNKVQAQRYSEKEKEEGGETSGGISSGDGAIATTDESEQSSMETD